MKRPRLLLDIDGVVANFLEPCLKIVNDIMGSTYTHDDVKQWDFMRGQFGMTQQQIDEVYKRMYVEGFCINIPLYKGAKEGVTALQEIADIYPVTASLGGPWWAFEREKWLLAHLGFPPTRVVSTTMKFLCNGDILVDDRTQNCADWQTEYPYGVAIRWERPNNAGDPWDGLRASNWDTLYGIVLGVAARVA